MLALTRRIVQNGFFSVIQGKNLSTSAKMDGPKNVAVVLSGCGVYDGTEIHEAAALLAALTRGDAVPVIYALNADQAHVVDHQCGQEMDQRRNVLNESARIARGNVKPLSELTTASADAIVFPGGFGAAKNLSDFGFKGPEMSVNAEVEKVLRDFNQAGKPIALCCIAPIIAAKVFGSQGVKVTLGKTGDEAKWPYAGSIAVASSFGANTVEHDVHEVCIDEVHKIITSPAYMYNGKFHEIQDGVSNMIQALLRMI